MTSSAKDRALLTCAVVLFIAAGAGCVIVIMRGLQSDTPSSAGKINAAPRTDQSQAASPNQNLADAEQKERRVEARPPFDFSDLQVDMAELRAGGPGKDGIEALVQPQRVPVGGAETLAPAERIIEVEIGDEAVAYPILMLNWHEVINDVISDRAIAVTYCPLCDSAVVFDRMIDGRSEPIEFGVSGLLLNSNVLLYDRFDDSLWSQLDGSAISGPNAGVQLRTLPARLTTIEGFAAAHPDGEMVSTFIDGSRKPYEQIAARYNGYLRSDDIWFPVPGMGTDLPPMTLGLGIVADDRAWFITHENARQNGPITVETSSGTVVVEATPAGMRVIEQPDGVMTMQSLYYAFSAFHPECEVID